MTPDSVLGALQERVAKLEQRADDLASRAIERFGNLADAIRRSGDEMAEDMKVFGPMLQDHAAMRADMRHLTTAVDKVVASQEALEDRFETERAERIQGQADRKSELEAAVLERKEDARIAKLEADKANREIRAKILLATLALVGVFITALGGVVVQLVSQGHHP